MSASSVATSELTRPRRIRSFSSSDSGSDDAVLGPLSRVVIVVTRTTPTSRRSSCTRPAPRTSRDRSSRRWRHAPPPSTARRPSRRRGRGTRSLASRRPPRRPRSVRPTRPSRRPRHGRQRTRPPRRPHRSTPSGAPAASRGMVANPTKTKYKLINSIRAMPER